MSKFIIAILLFGIISCKKGDTTGPTITLTWPADGESFAAGTVVHVKATINDPNEIHEVHVRVNNAASGAEVVHFEDHADAATLEVDQPFSIQSGVTYKIEVEASDHTGNETKVELSVKGN